MVVLRFHKILTSVLCVNDEYQNVSTGLQRHRETGKLVEKNPCQGKQREFGKFVKTQGKHREFGKFVKTQGILSKHRENTGNFVSSSCKYSDSKSKEYCNVCRKKVHFFSRSWIGLPSQFCVCNSHK